MTGKEAGNLFQINTANGAVTMHVGDTGSYTVTAARASGTAFTNDDRALYTVTSSLGAKVIERIYELNTELGNGKILIEFHNSDTDQLAPGVYNTEIRYIINPDWDGQKIVDGDIVRTPAILKSTLTLQGVIGEV